MTLLPLCARPRRPQKRVFVVTDLAVYNLGEGAARPLKRRIAIAGLAGVSYSEVSDEFVLHVPAEYDYRLVSPRKADALAALRAAAAALRVPLICSPSAQAELKGVVLTRVQAGLKRTPSGLGAGLTVLVPRSPKTAAAAAAAEAAAGGALAALSLDDVTGVAGGAASPPKSLTKKRADSARVLVVKAGTPPPIARKLSAADFAFAPSPDIGVLRPVREGAEDDDSDD